MSWYQWKKIPKSIWIKDFWPKNPKAVACYRAFYSMKQWLEQIIFFAESLFKKQKSETRKWRRFAILCQKLGVPQSKNNAEEVEILFTVEFILFYFLYERCRIVILQVKVAWQIFVEISFSIPTLSLQKWMLYEMGNVIYKYSLPIHLYYDFIFSSL